MKFRLKYVGLEYQGSADFLPQSLEYLRIPVCGTGPGHCECNSYM